MKKSSNLVGAALTVILMALIGLTSTSTLTAQVITSPVVSYLFENGELEIYMSGSQQSHNPKSIVAKVKFTLGDKLTAPVVEKLPVHDLGFDENHIDAVSIRDLYITPNGQIRMLTGTFKPKILSFDGKVWTTLIEGIEGWGLQNNGSAGGFAVSGDGSLFLPGMWIVGSRTGIYKSSPDGKNFTFFEKAYWPMDLCVSDGYIYAVENHQQSNKVTLFDEKTGALTREVMLPVADHRAVAVAKDGSMFIADFSGLITHISRDGTVIAKVFVKADRYNDGDLSPINLNDIDLSPDGQHLAIGSSDGYVGVLPVDLKSFHLLRFGPFTYNTFVAWPPRKNK
jgi:WD40 repeat protein